MNPESLGRVLRYYRDNKGWSRKDLAQVSGLAPSTIQEAEEGGNPTMTTLVALTDALEVTVPLVWEQAEADLSVDDLQRLSGIYEKSGSAGENLPQPPAVTSLVPIPSDTVSPPQQQPPAETPHHDQIVGGARLSVSFPEALNEYEAGLFQRLGLVLTGLGNAALSQAQDRRLAGAEPRRRKTDH